MGRPIFEPGHEVQPLRIEQEDHITLAHVVCSFITQRTPIAIISNTDDPLEVADSRLDAGVQGEVEQLESHAVWQAIQMHPLPEILPVDLDGLLAGQRFNVEVWIAPLGDAPLGFTAGIVTSAGIDALVVEHPVNDDLKGHYYSSTFDLIYVRSSPSRDRKSVV